MPTRVGGAGGFNPLAGSRGRGGPKDENVDEDGWGADAPPVTRTQLEKVQPAYKPTKVNMDELVKQKQEPSRFSGSSREPVSNPNVVKGGYTPVGKVDIAALRREAHTSGTLKDDRPETVKGAYEPVGKVDIAAIRARAQPRPDDSPSITGVNEPKSMADRSASFTQSERLTTMPKPKVANRFGAGASTFTGTKAPTPGVYGFSQPASVSAAPVGTASKTFADEGGKTPAQIWAEKKNREQKLSGVADTSYQTVTPPVKAQTSGGGEWKSSYTGKTWAPVQTTATGRSATSNTSQERAEDHQEEAVASPTGGFSAIRDRFKGAAPMGAPSIPKAPTGEPSPPAIDVSNKPNAGGIPIPGLPTRPQPEYEEHEAPAIPTPPRAPRSPTPPTPVRESSPVRIAMPVGRSAEPEIEPPGERFTHPPVPAESMARATEHEEDGEPEASLDHEAAHTAGAQSGGKRALVQYDYEKAEDNELELHEGEYVTNIDMVDVDWWMGQNSKGEIGLFPSNYVELVEDDGHDATAATHEHEQHHEPEEHHEHEQYHEPEEHHEPEPAAVATRSTAMAGHQAGPTATAIYDYDAAEDNELTFAEGAKITGIVSISVLFCIEFQRLTKFQEFPDSDWWFGHHGGKQGLFPANYVQLDD
jgi:hypothetical protein